MQEIKIGSEWIDKLSGKTLRVIHVDGDDILVLPLPVVVNRKKRSVVWVRKKPFLERCELVKEGDNE